MSEQPTNRTIAIIAAVGTIATAAFTYRSSVYTADVADQTQRIVTQVQAESSERIALMTKHKEDRQADIELVKLALNMLSGGSGKDTTSSRLFAIQMLQKYSGVTIDKDVAVKWAEDGDIKFGSMAQALSNFGTDDMFNPPSVAELLRRQGMSPEEFKKMMGSSPLPAPEKN